MPLDPRSRAQETDDSGSGARTLSHGRGGAGNMGKEKPHAENPESLVTPSLKADKYTTGRGGTGNMAKNDPNHPEVARAAQDVNAPVPQEQENFHTGRGGAANVSKATDGAKTKEGAHSAGGKVNELLHKVGLKK